MNAGSGASALRLDQSILMSHDGNLNGLAQMAPAPTLDFLVPRGGAAKRSLQDCVATRCSIARTTDRPSAEQATPLRLFRTERSEAFTESGVSVIFRRTLCNMDSRTHRPA